MKKGKLFIMSGPSGSGKTTLHERILKNPRFKNKIVKTVSVTTRARRKGEKHNRDYIFVSKKMFFYKRKTGHFLESMKVFDNYYGTPRKAVIEHLKKGKNVLLCIDVKGTDSVRKQIPEAVTIFVKTPTFADLKKRLTHRGSEDKDTLKIRLETAKKELKEANNYKYTIINNSLTKAVLDLEDILTKEIEK